MFVKYKNIYNPQGNSINYLFNGEIITANFGRNTDTFDFSSLPDGEAGQIESSIIPNPIVAAKRENGVLYVELLNLYTDRLLSTQWQEVF